MTNYQTINVETLKTSLENENINLIDVREVYEYEDNHIPEAVNIPLSVLVEILIISIKMNTIISFADQVTEVDRLVSI